MADLDDTAPATLDDAIPVTKRKRGRPPKPFAMDGQFRNKQYRNRLTERTQDVHAALGLLLGAYLKTGLPIPPVTLNAVMNDIIRHETIKGIQWAIGMKRDFDGEGAQAIEWLTKRYDEEG